MSVTKSYNKHNGTYYAYDTQYVWDKTLQKRVQRKRCIGKFDPVTGDIIKNGSRGRKATASVFSADTVQKMKNSTAINSEIIAISERMKTISDSHENLGRELADLSSDMNALLLRLESES